LVLSTAARTCLALPGSFAGLLALVALTELFAAPVTIIADAAVMAACGKVRACGSWVGLGLGLGLGSGRLPARAAVTLWELCARGGPISVPCPDTNPRSPWLCV
jgi:hypothetical protein